MTFASSITVEFGDKSGLVDISDRVTGVQVVTNVAVGDMGTNRATLTLRNDDGELTPGGGGTYGAVDWFSQGVFIEGDTGSYTFTLFHGIITGFDLRDDGINSTITLTADDGLTVGGSSATEINIVGVFGGDLDFLLERIYNGYSGVAGTISAVQMPLLDNTTTNVDFIAVGLRAGEFGTGLITTAFQSVSPARDFVRTTLMPSGPNVAWPTTVDLSTSATVYKALELNINPVRSSGTALTFTLSEVPKAGELPFKNLSRGFPVDSMLNEAVVTTIPRFVIPFGSVVTVTSTDDASKEKYGTRAIQASAIMVGTGSASNAVSAETIADRWAHTYSSSEFVPRSLEVNETMVRAYVGSEATSEQAWAQLLDISTGPLQQAAIVFTPAGTASQVTERVVTLSRTISVTPSDIRLRLECMPLDQAAPFILDSSTLGVLDQNRLG